MVDEAASNFHTAMLAFYTMAKSKRLSDFLGAVSDEWLSICSTLKALGGIWRQQDH